MYTTNIKFWSHGTGERHDLFLTCWCSRSASTESCTPRPGWRRWTAWTSSVTWTPMMTSRANSSSPSLWSVICFLQYSCIKLTRYLQLSFRSVQSTVETKRDQVRRILQLPPSSSSSSSETETSAAREMETAVTAYLRRATDTFDLSKNVEVWEQNLGYIRKTNK